MDKLVDFGIDRLNFFAVMQSVTYSRALREDYGTRRWQTLINTNSAGIDVFTERVVPAAPDCENDALSCKVGTFPAGTQPSSIAIYGQFAFVANFGSNDVTTLTITSTDSGLAVSLAQLSVHGVGMGPSSVVVDSSGKFLYVTNQLSNDVLAFAVDQSTGKLTPISGSPFATGQGPTFLVTVQ